MLVEKTFYYFMIWSLLVFIIILINTIKFNNRKEIGLIISFNILYILHLIVIGNIFVKVFYIDIGWDFIMYFAIFFIAIIIFSISTVIAFKKRKRIESKKISILKVLIFFMILLIPVCTIYFSYKREKQLIESSDLLYIDLRTNDAMHSKTRIYAVNFKENTNNEISLGTYDKGDKLENFVQNKSKESFLYEITYSEDIDDLVIQGRYQSIENLPIVDKENIKRILLDVKNNNKGYKNVTNFYVEWYKDINYYYIEKSPDDKEKSILGGLIYNGCDYKVSIPINYGILQDIVWNIDK